MYRFELSSKLYSIQEWNKLQVKTKRFFVFRNAPIKLTVPYRNIYVDLFSEGDKFEKELKEMCDEYYETL